MGCPLQHWSSFLKLFFCTVNLRDCPVEKDRGFDHRKCEIYLKEGKK